MKYAVFRGGLTRACPPGVDLPPQQPLPLAQLSCSPEYIVKAILGRAWAVAVVIVG